MSTDIVILTFVFLLTVDEISCYPGRKRYLLYDPSDQSLAFGYQNHQVHDLTSLVNEASATAHGGGSAPSGSAQGPYNIPNFPAMGLNSVQPQTGSQTSSSGGSSAQVSSASGSGSTSFGGTNQWRCDAHVVEQCDVQCLDVDPKDGCPFCIPGCTNKVNSGTGSASSQGGQSTGSSQSIGTLTGAGQTSSGGGTSNSGAGSGQVQQTGSATQTGQTANTVTIPFVVGPPNIAPPMGGTNQNPGTLTGGNLGGVTQSPGGNVGGVNQSPGTLSGGSVAGSGSLSQNAGTLSGTLGQSSGGLGGNLIQQPSGLAGTGGNSQGTASSGKQGTSGSAVAATTSGPVICLHYPPNCPRKYTSVDQYGCLVCTILQQISVTTQAPLPTTTRQTSTLTCAPKRCVAPCNKGIVLDALGCPHCVCPAHV